MGLNGVPLQSMLIPVKSSTNNGEIAFAVRPALLLLLLLLIMINALLSEAPTQENLAFSPSYGMDKLSTAATRIRRTPANFGVLPKLIRQEIISQVKMNLDFVEQVVQGNLKDLRHHLRLLRPADFLLKDCPSKHGLNKDDLNKGSSLKDSHDKDKGCHKDCHKASLDKARDCLKDCPLKEEESLSNWIPIHCWPN